MQAIILAAGRGRRLGGLSDDKPKCFLEIKGKRIIDHQIDLLRAHHVCRIVVVTGYRSLEVKDGLKKHHDIAVAFNPFYATTNVLTSFWFGKNLLSEDYIFLHGDTIFDEAILKALLSKDAGMVMAVDFKKCEEEHMKVKIVGDAIVKITKQMPPQEAAGEFIGLAKVSKPFAQILHDKADQFMLEEKFDCFFEAAVQRVIDQSGENDKVSFVDISGRFWEEIDFQEDYARAQSRYGKS